MATIRCGGECRRWMCPPSSLLYGGTKLPALEGAGVSGEVGWPRSAGTGILAFRGFLLSPRDRCCGLAAQSHLYPHPSLPLPRLRFDDRVRPKVQAYQRYAERGGSNCALPLRRLRRKKVAVAKPTMPKMARYEEGSGMGARLVMRNPRNSSPVLGVRFRRQAKVLFPMGA